MIYSRLLVDSDVVGEVCFAGLLSPRDGSVKKVCVVDGKEVEKL